MPPYFIFLFIPLTLISTINGEIPSNVSPEVWRLAKAGKQEKTGNYPNVMIEFHLTPETTRITETTLEEISSIVATSDTRSSRSSVGSTRLLESINVLQNTSEDLMSPVIERLQLLGVDYKVFWIAKIIYIPSITIPVILEIAGIDIVIWIRLEHVIPVPEPPQREKPKPRPPPVGNSTWNLGLIDARCDGIPCLGDGVLVAIMDTGVRGDHVELKDRWIGGKRGWWDGLDPVTSPNPFDIGGHGTHVMGTILGKSVGVAPAAKWMACRLGDEWFPESAILECGQFMCAPWEWDDKTRKDTRDPTARPHVINNSWGADGGSQLLDPTKDSNYQMLEVWTALGIIHIFSNGNSGPGCATGGSPGNFDIALAVGAVDSTTTISYWSSRGPTFMAKDLHKNSTAKGSCLIPSPPGKCIAKGIKGKRIVQLVKPDISAPGQNITSSWNTGPEDYIAISGTSMASPHVTGTVALMICAHPGPHWNQLLAYEILTQTADTSWLDLKGEGDASKSVQNYSFLKSSHAMCNVAAAGICDWYPNNMYGYGLADACDAVKLAKNKTQVTHRNKPCGTLLDI